MRVWRTIEVVHAVEIDFQEDIVTLDSETICIVVGDGYCKFAMHPHVITATECLERLRTSSEFGTYERIVIAQGVPDYQRVLLRGALGTTAVSMVGGEERAPTELTHKNSGAHVLISKPWALGSGRYRMGLILDDAADRLSDHVTGQHIGAMNLIEAARQATILAIELQYRGTGAQKWGFILERLNSRYEGYAFPVSTVVEVQVEERGPHSERQVPVATSVTFEQAGHRVCCVELDVMLCESQLLEKVEQRQARRASALERTRIALEGDHRADAAERLVVQ